MDCRSLDGQVVRPNDKELEQLLQRFVPIRITSLKDVDLNTFRFDYDLTFAALMMDANGGTYSRFGTRDGDSATDRLSVPALKNAMRAALARHAKGERGVGPSRPRFTAADYPAFRAMKMSQEPCYHCHYANDARYAQLRADGKFTKDALFQYPLPENIGLTLDVDRNNVVRGVLPGSPAQKAGVRPGDVLTRADRTPVLTGADLQFALNLVPDPGAVTVTVERGGAARQPMTLPLPRGWRKTDISWRASQGMIPPIFGIWEQPLTEAQKRQRGIGAGKLALRVSFLFPGARWEGTRGDLRLNDVIVGVGGKELPSMLPRQFHSYIRMNFNVGDTATLTILRGDQRRDIRVPCTDPGEP